jgi:hypothetical protein
MGNNYSYIDNCLKFERILDSEYQVYIGIASLDKGLTSQVLRIGDYHSKYFRLQEFRQDENILYYYFENNVSMTLEKHGEYILMDIVGCKNEISKPLHPVIVKTYKPIGLSNMSNEIDKIYELFTGHAVK